MRSSKRRARARTRCPWEPGASRRAAWPRRSRRRAVLRRLRGEGNWDGMVIECNCDADDETRGIWIGGVPEGRGSRVRLECVVSGGSPVGHLPAGFKNTTVSVGRLCLWDLFPPTIGPLALQIPLDLCASAPSLGPLAHAAPRSHLHVEITPQIRHRSAGRTTVLTSRYAPYRDSSEQTAKVCVSR